MRFVLAVTGALGAFVGGLVFEWASSLPAATGNPEPTVVYLMVTQSLMICGGILCRLLKGHQDQPSLTTLIGRLIHRCFGQSAG